MIKEDYVSFEVAKLLKEKGFKNSNGMLLGKSGRHYNKYETFPSKDMAIEASIDCEDKCPLVTLQMAMKWLREVHNILVILDYDYEYTDKSYCYKIYKLEENGKPERVPIEGVRYDMLGEPHTEIVAYRDYKRSYFDYKTYEEACEAAIKYCLEHLI